MQTAVEQEYRHRRHIALHCESRDRRRLLPSPARLATRVKYCLESANSRTFVRILNSANNALSDLNTLLYQPSKRGAFCPSRRGTY